MHSNDGVLTQLRHRVNRSWRNPIRTLCGLPDLMIYSYQDREDAKLVDIHIHRKEYFI